VTEASLEVTIEPEHVQTFANLSGDGAPIPLTLPQHRTVAQFSPAPSPPASCRGSREAL
jgi:hypothetical protein